MKTVAVIGTQWGDEGKGKIVDMLAADADVVVRYQGGNNAAHTLVVDGKKFVLRLVPAGALHPGKACVIGNGLVVNPIALLEEISDLKRSGHLADDALFKISYDAHMVMPYHIAIDRAREQRLGKRAIGTTGFGIGPTYEDKMARVGLRFEDLLDFKFFSEKLRRNVAEKNAYLKAILKAKPVKADEILDAMKKARRRLMPYLCDTGAYVSDAIDAGRKVLFEGAHGTMLDIDHGTYPYVTSSNCVASAVFGGTGIGPGNLDAVLGISKGYTTRVGAGPFPSEFTGYLADSLREEGDEFGSATGRPRRIGWFDAVLARYVARVNGMWALALTKLDVLTGIDPLKIVVGYQIKGKHYDRIPPSHRMLINAKPIFEEMPGWHESPASARSLAELPAKVRNYVDRIAELVGVPIAMIGVGKEREATIVVRNPFAD
ncbi:MAG: adenylosuccinate synthase [Candidatus Binatus sp.]|uniref:adenylosuccinate synthase n=1 Tax=Candidatus Binatus sp. TaxID=2811406 RepID=UPI00271EB3EA|nr:adenylosuccinate synthase [Candidatus Binatus sp.]MDO8433488.1 adenylosuccinate synthase [Candidatus Binatus sp.]